MNPWRIQIPSDDWAMLVHPIRGAKIKIYLICRVCRKWAWGRSKTVGRVGHPESLPAWAGRLGQFDTYISVKEVSHGTDGDARQRTI